MFNFFKILLILNVESKKKGHTEDEIEKVHVKVERHTYNMAVTSLKKQPIILEMFLSIKL